jgi:hypothetical protein
MRLSKIDHMENTFECQFLFVLRVASIRQWTPLPRISRQDAAPTWFTSKRGSGFQPRKRMINYFRVAPGGMIFQVHIHRNGPLRIIRRFSRMVAVEVPFVVTCCLVILACDLMIL